MSISQSKNIFLFLILTLFVSVSVSAAVPAITSHTPNATLASDTETFSWNANGEPVTDWYIIVGSTKGGFEYGGDFVPAATTSLTISGLPRDGSIVYVNLKYRSAGTWLSVKTTYRAPFPSSVKHFFDMSSVVDKGTYNTIVDSVTGTEVSLFGSAITSSTVTISNAAKNSIRLFFPGISSSGKSAFPWTNPVGKSYMVMLSGRSVWAGSGSPFNGGYLSVDLAQDHGTLRMGRARPGVDYSVTGSNGIVDIDTNLWRQMRTPLYCGTAARRMGVDYAIAFLVNNGVVTHYVYDDLRDEYLVAGKAGPFPVNFPPIDVPEFTVKNGRGHIRMGHGTYFDENCVSNPDPLAPGNAPGGGNLPQDYYGVMMNIFDGSPPSDSQIFEILRYAREEWPLQDKQKLVPPTLANF